MGSPTALRLVRQRALLFNIVLLLAGLSVLEATLTLPGSPASC
jgi:preprotein translocase subunit SecD